MTREIKFRGKTKVGNEWIYGTTISQGTIKRKANMWYMEVAENKWTGLQPGSLGQYTGLKDRNGDEIYEGDILERGELSGKGKVYFSDGTFKVDFKGYAYSLDFVVSDYFPEIVGNIYDNPKLIDE